MIICKPCSKKGLSLFICFYVCTRQKSIFYAPKVLASAVKFVAVRRLTDNTATGGKLPPRKPDSWSYPMYRYGTPSYIT